MRATTIAVFLMSGLASGCGASEAATTASEGSAETHETPSCPGEGDVESREPQPGWRSCVARQGAWTGWYDERGLQVRWEFDREPDGVADTVETMAYDARGHRVRETLLNPRSGEPSTIVSHRWEAERRVSSEQDHDADGSAEVQITYEYDEAGILVGERWDSPVDGRVDTVYRLEADGERRVSERYRYSESGELEQRRRDLDGDGVLETCEGACEPAAPAPATGHGNSGFGIGD